ncbi:MAG: ABC transporter transmembrane domain-containing protein [Marinibacterium sp.]
MIELYAIIWRISARRQILLIGLSVAIAALAAVPLGYQKTIINDLTEATIAPRQLVWLCAQMMALILLSLGLKWALGLGANTLGEDVIRRIRMRLYRTATDPGSRTDVTSGALATMVSAEAEELGKFAGSAYSEPVVQLGTMVSVIGYVAASQPVLGLIALAIVAPQVGIVLVTQRLVNARVAERVRLLRKATQTIVAEDLQRLNAGILGDFDAIYETRRGMFLWKLSTKFAISAINGAGTVGLLLLGGWYVLQGRTDVGTVVAATMGLARLQGPTGFLIAFYRQVSATQVKYELLKDIAGPRRRA